MPLFLDKDIGGPWRGRWQVVASAVFDAIAGYDLADPVTAASQGKRADSYSKFLDKDGVRGMRLGVVRQLFTPQNTDPDVMKRWSRRSPICDGWAHTSSSHRSPRSTTIRRMLFLLPGPSSSTSTTTCRGSRPARR